MRKLLVILLSLTCAFSNMATSIQTFALDENSEETPIVEVIEEETSEVEETLVIEEEVVEEETPIIEEVVEEVLEEEPVLIEEEQSTSEEQEDTTIGSTEKVIEPQKTRNTVTAAIDMTVFVADESGPGWSWDYDTKTLTLTDVDFTVEETSKDAVLSLPENSTIVSNGEKNTITATIGAYGILCDGNLTIKGGAPIEIDSIVEGLDMFGSLTVDATAMKITTQGNYALWVNGKTMDHALILNGGTYLKEDYPVGYDGDGWYTFVDWENDVYVKEFEILVSDQPSIDIVKTANDFSAKANDSTMSKTLSIQAKAVNTSEALTYQWYSCDDYEGTNATPISGATSSSYTFSGAHDVGDYYFYCKVNAGSASRNFPVSMVEVTETGKFIIDDYLSFYEDTASVDLLDTYGYKWDMATQTLTLDSVTIINGRIYVGSTINNLTIVLADGSKNVSEFYSNSTNYGLHINAKSTTIKGNGSLIANNISTRQNNAAMFFDGSLKVVDGANISVSSDNGIAALYVTKTLSVLNTAKITANSAANGAVYLGTTSNNFTITQPMDATIANNYVCDASGNVAKTVVIEANTNPTVLISSVSENQAFKALDETFALDLSVVAEKYNTDGALTYTWYQCTDENKTNPTVVANTSTYTFSGSKEIGKYYFYVEVGVEGTEARATSEVITLTATPGGHEIYTGSAIKLSNVDKDYSKYGIVYDYDEVTNKGTLTLDNVYWDTTTTTSSCIGLLSNTIDFVINVKGTNVINSNYKPIYVGDSYYPERLTITGGGTLNLSSKSYEPLDLYGTNTRTDLVIDGGTKVYAKALSGTTSQMRSLTILDEGTLLDYESSKNSNIYLQAYADTNFAISYPTDAKVYKSSSNYTITNASNTALSHITLVKSSVVGIAFDQNPVNQTVEIGEDFTLTAHAKAVNAPEDTPITYKWYNANTTELLGEGATLNVESFAEEAMIFDYYCEATMTVDGTEYKATSVTATVYFMADGVQPLIKSLNISGINQSSVTSYNANGISFDGDKRILTLNNAIIDARKSNNYALVVRDAVIYVPSGTKSMIYGSVDGHNLTVFGGGTLEIHVSSGADVFYSVYTKNRMSIYDSTLILYQEHSTAHYASQNELNVVNSDVYMYRKSESSYPIGRFVTVLGSEVVTGSSTSNIRGNVTPVYNETKKMYEAVIKRSTSPVDYIRFATLPKDEYTTTVNKTVTLSAEAVTTLSNEITYNWYVEKEGVATLLGTGKDFTFKPTTHGIYKVYVQAVADAYSVKSDYAYVLVTAEGKSVAYLHNITKSSASVDKLATEGWKWDKDTLTLTFNNVVSNQRLLIPENSKVVLTEGSHNAFVTYGGYGLGVGTKGTIEGAGTLEVTTFESNNSVVADSTSELLQIQKGAKVYLEAVDYSRVFSIGRLVIYDKGTELHARGNKNAQYNVYSSVYLSEYQDGDFAIYSPKDAFIQFGGGAYIKDDNGHVYDFVLCADVLPKVTFTKYPNEENAIRADETLNLSVDVVVENAEDPTITYEWWNVDTNKKLASTKDFAFKPTAKGYYHLMAKASITVDGVTYVTKGNVFTVTVGLVTTPIIITDDTEDTIGTDWIWDKDTKTLTLNNLWINVETDGNREIQLPDYSTIYLPKGTKNIVDSTDNAYPIRNSGTLTIKGEGELTINSTSSYAIIATDLYLDETNVNINCVESTSDYPIYNRLYLRATNLSIQAKGNSTFNIKELDATIVTKGEKLNDNTYQLTENTETGLYEFETVRDTLYFSSVPAKENTTSVGKETKLSVNVKSLTSGTVTYAWYQTSDLENPTNGAKKVSSSKTYTFTPSKRGQYYYYCVVTRGTKKITSDVVAVTVANKNTKAVTESIVTLDYSKSFDYLDTKGYAWNQDTHTLTLNGIDMMDNPFTSGSNNIRLSAGDTIVVNNTNYVTYNKDSHVYVNGGSTDSIVEFTGNGTLNVNYFNSDSSPTNTVVRFNNGVTVNIDDDLYEYRAYEIDDATLKINGYFDVQNKVTVNNGANLVVSNYAQFDDDFIVGKDSTVLIYDRAALYGNLVIDQGAFVGVGSNLNMDYSHDYVDRTATIRGTLHITGNDNYASFSIYSTKANPVILEGSTYLKTPNTAVLESSDNSHYYVIDGARVRGEMLFVEDGVSLTKITAIGAIKGTAKYNETLTAGAITPSNATVTYTWQYADTANGQWKTIENIGKTYKVESKYANKYIRVIAKGAGKYTGKVTSAVVGPVAGNPNLLSGLYGIGLDDEMNVFNSLFNGENYQYYNYAYIKDDNTYRYVAETVSSEAVVTIRNKTTDFEKVGKVVDVPMVIGVNEIEIVVSYKGNETVYKVSHNVSVPTYNVRIENYYENGSITAKWLDENGTEQERTISTYGTVDFIDVNRGTLVTVTSTVERGKVVYTYGYGQEADYRTEGHPYSFVVKGYNYVYISESTVGAVAPEFVKAEWSFGDFAQVSVKALEKEVGSYNYFNAIVEVYDEDGYQVQYIDMNEDGYGVNTDGVYQFMLHDLDRTKKYTIKAYYPELWSSYYDLADYQYAQTVLEASRVVRIIPEVDHLVLKPNEFKSISIDFNGYLYSALMVHTISDTSVIDDMATNVFDNGDGTYSLDIQTIDEGTSYITLEGDIDAAQGRTYATIRVDVIDSDIATALNLGTTSGTLNIYDNSSLTIPVYQMDCGHDIESAVFVNEAMNERFAIEVLNDRTIKVTPKVPEDSDSMNWKTWVAEEGVGTYSSQIQVNYNGTSSRRSTETLKITLTSKVPTVKVSSVSLNSFYNNHTKNLKFTVSGKKVVASKVDVARVSKAIPSWLQLSEDGKSVSLVNGALTSKTASGKLYLKVWLEGWRIPVQVYTTVKVAYTAPSVKLKATTVTVPSNEDSFSLPSLQLISGNKKVSYNSLQVVDVKFADNVDLAMMSNKDRLAYKASLYYRVYNLDENGTVRFTKASSNTQPIRGKVMMYVYIKDGVAPIKLPFTIKTTSAPTLTLAKSSITLYPQYGNNYDRDDQVVSYKTTNGLYIDTDDFSYKATLKGDTSNTDYTSHLDIDFFTDGIEVRRNEKTLANKTYKVQIKYEGISKAINLEVKTSSSAATLKLNKTSLTVNRAMGDYIDVGQVTLSSSLANMNLSLENSDITIIKPNGKEDTLKEGFNYFIYSNNTNKPRIDFSLTSKTLVGTYKIKIRAKQMNDVYVTKTLSIIVKNTAPTIKTDKSTYSLHNDIGLYSRTVIDISGLDKYYVNGFDFVLKDSKGRVLSNQNELYMDSYGDDVVIETNSNTVYGKTYKITMKAKLDYGTYSKSKTVTVKVAKANAALSISGKSSGSIDLTRYDTSKVKFNLSYAYWTASNYFVGISNRPVLTWEVYAKNGTKNVTTSAGALNDNGLVATSEDANSWFTNVENVDENPYNISLMVNSTSSAWFNNQVSPSYTYTLKAKMYWPDLDKTYTSGAIKFTVKQGSIKFSADKTSITLNKKDPTGRQYVTYSLTNTDKDNIAKVAHVEFVSSTLSKKLEIVPVYDNNGKYTFAIGWKDGVVSSSALTETVKIKVYLYGNNPSRNKPNATVSIKVKIK